MLSRVLGLIRELAMAATFGASGVTDAFQIAYRIPNMLRDLFAEGSFSAAFVPILSKVKEEGDDSVQREARKLIWSSFCLLTGITFFIVLGIEYFASDLVALMTDAEYAKDREKFELTVVLVRIMAPFLMLISLAALVMGALNTFKAFFIPSFAPATFNVAMIGAILFGSKYFASKGMEPILALAWGVLLGGAFQFLFQVPLMLKKRLGPVKGLKLWDENQKSILGRMGIGTIGVATNQLNIIVNTYLATGTVVGAVSWLTYAFRLYQFPVGIIGVSLANSNLVHFSAAWKGQRKEEAMGYFKSSISYSLFLLLFCTGLLIGLSEPMVHLVFERGAFTAEDTQQTQWVLKFFALGLPSYGLFKIFSPTFYTLDNPKFPVMTSVGCVIFNILFCWVLTPLYGFWILPLGTSLSVLINAGIQFFKLKKDLGFDLLSVIGGRQLKMMISSSISGIAAWWLSELYIDYSSIFLMKSAIFVMILLLSGLSYLGILFLLGEGNFLKKVLAK